MRKPELLEFLCQLAKAIQNAGGKIPFCKHVQRNIDTAVNANWFAFYLEWLAAFERLTTTNVETYLARGFRFSNIFSQEEKNTVHAQLKVHKEATFSPKELAQRIADTFLRERTPRQILTFIRRHFQEKVQLPDREQPFQSPDFVGVNEYESEDDGTDEEVFDSGSDSDEDEMEDGEYVELPLLYQNMINRYTMQEVEGYEDLIENHYFVVELKQGEETSHGHGILIKKATPYAQLRGSAENRARYIAIDTKVYPPGEFAEDTLPIEDGWVLVRAWTSPQAARA